MVNAAFNLKEVRDRANRHQKEFMEIRGELMDREEELQVALIKLLEGEAAEAGQ